jgi:hypothetical protein
VYQGNAPQHGGGGMTRPRATGREHPRNAGGGGTPPGALPPRDVGLEFGQVGHAVDAASYSSYPADAQRMSDGGGGPRRSVHLPQGEDAALDRGDRGEGGHRSSMGYRGRAIAVFHRTSSPLEASL